MFEQTFLEGAARTRRAWTVPAGFAGQIAVVAALALMPTVFFEGIPAARLAPPTLAAPTGYQPQRRPDSVQVVDTRIVRPEHVFREPSKIHHGVDLGPMRPAEAPPDPGPACVGFCVVGAPPAVGPLAQVLHTTLFPPVERPPDPVVRRDVRPTPTPAPIRVTSGPQEAKLINRVTPVYPPIAIEFRIAGVVHLAAIITADGRIRELQVISGHPYLVPAAVEAVRQWVYRPTMLNGAPVEVMTDISVIFNLNQR